jgi:hypothetical protein
MLEMQGVVPLSTEGGVIVQWARPAGHWRAPAPPAVWAGPVPRARPSRGRTSESLASLQVSSKSESSAATWRRLEGCLGLRLPVTERENRDVTCQCH